MDAWFSRHGRTCQKLALLLMATLILFGCGKPPHYEKSILVMDTVVTLSAEGEAAKAAIEESIDWLQAFDALAAPQKEESDIARLRDMAGRGYVKLHPDIYHILEISQEYSRLTDGAWDITTGPLTELWGMGTEHPRVPSREEVDRARKLVGWQHLRLRPEDGSAMLELPGMSVSLGGIAKGFAADKVRCIYARHGIKNGLINMGASSMCALGQKDGHPWNIGLRHPRKEGDGVHLAVIPLEDAFLSTSGDYERMLEADGKRYHHILDPATGCPAERGVMSVTVVVSGEIPDAGALSDLLTTAVFVMGAEKGKAFLDSLPEGIRGGIVDTSYGIHTSHGFAQCMKRLREEFHFAP